jgi:hypothetical protein
MKTTMDNVVGEHRWRRLGRVIALVIFAQALANSQSHAAPYRAPRTESGAPDLQGIWTNLSLTTLERPSEAKTLIVSEAEASGLEHLIADKTAHPADDKIGARDSEWFDGSRLARIGGQARTSWIVSPADGQTPYTPQARKAFAAAKAAVLTVFDGPEVRPTSERCLLGVRGANGPPILNARYAANYQFVQTRDRVVIVSEMVHDARIIRLNGLHLPKAIRPWMGDSIGHWEGETLVVETTNFNPGEVFRVEFLMSSDAKVIERFTRVSPSEILYQFSVEDPATFTQVWRGEMPFVATQGPIYEYACHEGNYSLTSILSGARQQEAATRAEHSPAGR